MNMLASHFRIYVLFVIFVLGNIKPGIGALAIIAYLLLNFNLYVAKENFNGVVWLLTLLLVFTVVLGFLPSLDDPRLYIEEVIRLASWVALALIGRKLGDDDLDLFYRLFMLSIFIGLPMIFLSDLRFRVYFGHSNHLAYFTLLPLIFYITRVQFKHRLVYVLFLFFICLLTLSSGGNVSFMAVVLFYYIRSHGGFKNIILFSVVAIPVFYYSGLYEDFYNKITVFDWDEILRKAYVLSFGSEGSLVWRVTYWLAIINDFLYQIDFSTLMLGKGVKVMSAGNYLYDFMIRDPHNDYVRLLVERGVLGLLFFVVVLIKLVTKSNNSLLLSVGLFVPMFFGNILVSFPYFFAFILFLSVESKDQSRNNVKGLENEIGSSHSIKG